MQRNEKIKILRTYLKATKQVQAIMGMDVDCEISNIEYRKLKKDFINDPKIFMLAKKFNERSENNGYR